VGFVSHLPHELVAAFHATLEEVLEADVVVHVRDIAHPDSLAQKHDVERVMKVELDLGEAIDKGLIEALNKIDLLDDDEQAAILAEAARDEHLYFGRGDDSDFRRGDPGLALPQRRSGQS
jgi:GTP-binding protein HflX